MNKILNNYSLKNLNSFGIDIKAKLFSNFNSENELIKLLSNKSLEEKSVFILGDGSNILFTKDFEGLVLANKINGIDIISEDQTSMTIRVGAGENWHDFVLWSIKKELSGIENLALIPGLVGASPIQNIGAYGAEVKDVITKVNYVELDTGLKKELSNYECKFDYRNSIFKNQLKNKTVVTYVTYRLSKKPLNNIKYGAITDELKSLKKDPSPASIAEAVINIRNKKLPNPKLLGNSGSFFKNPIINNEDFKKLKNKFPNIISYKISNTHTKLAAGWLIEDAGYKGYRLGDAGVHEKQALVLVNYGKASGKDIFDLANMIKEKIKEKYGIVLEPEVNIL